ncbi:MAG: hypothetical protein HW421_873 [Ignavibacteria bacterium]|nr:hypothetical protein [Ignavibacteria bacterium]
MEKDKIIEALTNYKEKNSEKFGIIDLGLFGSYANNKNIENSDIDIFIKTKTPDPFNIVQIKEDLKLLFNTEIDIVRLRDKMNPYLKSRIETEGIYV